MNLTWRSVLKWDKRRISNTHWSSIYLIHCTLNCYHNHHRRLFNNKRYWQYSKSGEETFRKLGSDEERTVATGNYWKAFALSYLLTSNTEYFKATQSCFVSFCFCFFVLVVACVFFVFFFKVEQLSMAHPSTFRHKNNIHIFFWQGKRWWNTLLQLIFFPSLWSQNKTIRAISRFSLFFFFFALFSFYKD